MPSCEKCWSDAYLLAVTRGKPQGEVYEELVRERENAGTICTPRQQAGQWWDEETQSDKRLRRE